MAHMLFVSCFTYVYWHVSLPLVWADPNRPPARDFQPLASQDQDQGSDKGSD